MAALPPPPELLAALNEGVAHHRAGMLDAAERCYRRALAIAPEDHNALRLMTGLALYRENWPAALEFARRATDLQPNHAELHRLLAVALMENGDPDGAIAMAQRALDLGDGPLARLVLANANFRKGDNAAAAAIYREILRREPRHAAAHVNLGKLLLHQAIAAEGERHLTQALEIEPNHVEALRSLGEHMAATNRPRKAAELLHRLALLRPDDIDLLRELGEILLGIEQYVEAMRAFRAIVDKHPEDADARIRLGFALMQIDQPASALRSVEKVLADHPADAATAYFAAQVQDRLYRMDESRLNLARAAADPAASGAMLQAWAYRLLALQDIAPAQVVEAHRAWAGRFADPLTAQASARPPRGGADKKLRIGYVSPDFRRHSMAYFIEPVIAHHDRGRFEVFCYDTKGIKDDINARLRKLADQWRDIAALDDQEVSAQIAADRIDILIDMAGFTAGNRLAVFAGRAAPVQATWLGYPATTGMAAMDWRIVDAISEPPHSATLSGSERLMRLAGGPLAFAPPRLDIPASRAEGGGAAAVFCSFNNIAKIQPSVIEAWAQILKQVPEATLILKDQRFKQVPVLGQVRAQFAARGVAGERLVLREHDAQAEHLAGYRSCDIALDTFPHNGGTTTCEALWMGVPVVALEGQAYVGRLGAAILRHGGFGDWVAPSIEDYVAKAVALAGDVKALRARRAEIRGQFLARLGNGPEFMADFERGLREIWADAVAARDAGAGAAPAAARP